MGRALVYGWVGMGLFVVLEFWCGGAGIELVCIMPDVSPKTHSLVQFCKSRFRKRLGPWSLIPSRPDGNQQAHAHDDVDFDTM